MVSSVDESTELVRVDVAVGEKRREQDRRSPDDMAAGHHETAGKRLSLTLQPYSCEQQMGSRAADIDAHRVHLDGFLPPDGLRYLCTLCVRYVAVLIKIVMQPQSIGQTMIQWRVHGSAKTSNALPDFGCRISGVSSDGISVDQLPPPVPAGMAMYCFPFARYVIGNPCAEVIRRV